MKNLIAGALIGTGILATAFVKAPQYKVDENSSRIHWKGSAKDRTHVGTFKLTGYVNADTHHKLTAGQFIIPIASIEDFDLPDNVKPALLNDLKSKNFFDIALHPNAAFTLKSAVQVKNVADTSAIRGANYILTGDFQMIGNTHTISFPAKVTVKGNTILTEAKFILDRTKWGMNIHTDPKEALYIYPSVNIELEVLTTKN